ncbi:MAG TPA: hypothetical protein VJT08_03570, partial [Terriglobales bacterium]|nr:hypothetical protein [Terriglobales bacterium]
AGLKPALPPPKLSGSLKMDDDAGGEAIVVLGLVEEMGMDDVELDDPPSDLGDQAPIEAEAEAIRERIVRDAARVEVSFADQDVGEGRHGRRERDLGAEQVIIQMRVDTLERAIVAVNVDDSAQPRIQFVLTGQFPAVGVERGRRIGVHKRIAAEYFDLIGDCLSASWSGEKKRK